MATRPGCWLFIVFVLLSILAAIQDCHAQALRFIGDARDSSGVIILTPARRAARGAVWTPKRHAISGGFTASFQFRIRGKGGAADISGRDGGDGFAFVIQDDNAAAIGGLGFGLGYAWNDREPGIARSLAVEFDYWDDTGLPYVPSFADFSHCHVAVHAANVPTEQNGAVQAYTRAVNTVIPATDDGAWHRVRIVYAPPWLDIYLDSARVLSWRGGLDTVIGSTDAYIGLTASTMSAWQTHEFTDIEIVPVGSDTVRWNRCPEPDTIYTIQRDTLRIVDTLRSIDTVEIPVPDTITIVRTITDTLRITDTLTISHTDTLRRVDTAYCYILRDTCWNALDTACNGAQRAIIPIGYIYSLSVEPNPADGLTRIRYTLGDRGIYVIRIYDMQGREMWKHSGNANEGEYEVWCGVSAFARGLYLVELIGRGGRVEVTMSVKR